MKKEINEMLTLGKEDKLLKLNQAFTLRARYIDRIGLNVGLNSHDSVDVLLSLEYTLAHDKCLFISRDIKSRTYTEIIDEIARAMEDIYSQISLELVREFRAGHLLGKVRTI